MQNTDKLYAVRIDRQGRFDVSEKGKYIAWCDDNWYGTTKDPTPTFTYKRAREIADQMDKHYVYNLSMIDENGVIDPINHLRKNRLFNLDIPIKKSLFTLNNGVFSKKKMFFKR